MYEKINLNIKLSKENGHINVSMILKNTTNSVINFTTPTSMFFNFIVKKMVNEKWENEYKNNYLYTQAIEYWSIPPGSRLIQNEKLPNIKQKSRELEDKLSMLSEEEKETYIKKNSIDIESEYKHKIIVSLNPSNENKIRESKDFIPCEITQRDIPEENISKFKNNSI